jgi:dTDP-glucose pyrophosphorylase
MNIVIPMAGEGSRFKVSGYENPKPLITVNDVPMIKLAVDTLDLEGKYIFVIRDYEDPKNTKALVSLLGQLKPGCAVIKTLKLTRGAAETCLLAKEHIGADEELVITNCDQIMDWQSDDFCKFVRDNDYAGVVTTYTSDDPKNSYMAADEQGNATYFKEKDVISNLALTGLHYWKKGRYFIEAAEKMIAEPRKQKGEFFVAPTYNFLIKKGLTVTNYHLKNNEYHPVGTPNDLKIYIGKFNEFDKPNKPPTIICDIDGTIFKHVHKYSRIPAHQPELNEQVAAKFDEWDSLGYKILLVTGRKESARAITEKALLSLGVPYDRLIMNAGNGKRVLINDKLTENSNDRSLSVNVITDAGFGATDWKKYGL